MVSGIEETFAVEAVTGVASTVVEDDPDARDFPI
jgi:hypothetical protein